MNNLSEYWLSRNFILQIWRGVNLFEDTERGPQVQIVTFVERGEDGHGQIYFITDGLYYAPALFTVITEPPIPPCSVLHLTIFSERRAPFRGLIVVADYEIVLQPEDLLGESIMVSPQRNLHRWI